ncbi:MAG TPA: hypothetical protein VFC78_10160 [Tepidisphaeraceae bacterium]|nr:hypothetical protein [Tepidisphaeraceae bacterium]
MHLLIRDLVTNKIEEVATRHLILADGKSAFIGPPPPASGDFGIKSHWIDVEAPRDAIELFGCRGCYGGLAAIEGGRWNAAFSVPGERLRNHHGDVDALFAELRTENAALDRQLAGAKRVLPWLASPLPRYAVRRAWPDGTIPIGNAAAAIEPIGGEGMGLALRSAELAAGALAEAGDDWGPEAAAKLRRAFQRLWRPRRAGCRAAARIVSFGVLSEAATDWLGSDQRLGQVAMGLMGKGAQTI